MEDSIAPLFLILLVAVFIILGLWSSKQSLSEQLSDANRKLDKQAESIYKAEEELKASEKALQEKTDALEKYELSYSEIENLKKEYSEKLILLEKTKAAHEDELNKEKENYKNRVLYNLASTDDRLKWYQDIIDSSDMNKDVSYRIKNNYFITSTMYPMYQKSLETDRAKDAQKGNFIISVDNLVEINSKILSVSSGETYDTSLTKCNCKDFLTNKHLFGETIPCKHMLALAFSVNAFIRKEAPHTVIMQEINEVLKEDEKIRLSNNAERLRLKARESNLEEEKKKFKLLVEKKQAKFEKEKKDFNESYKKKIAYLEVVEKISKEKLQTFPYLADIIARYKVEVLDIRVRDPITKKELTSKLKSLEKQVALLENQLAIYEYTFPILEELKTLDVHELEKAARDADGTGFNYQWLSAEEYAALTSTEKQQKWLERYFNARSRTAWEAGIKYERYIGYLCEKEGYSVNYTGALLKLEDMGRDLIATNKNNVYIIQCKRFSENKEIHENHIFQLYGSVYHYKAENPGKNVSGVFVTSAHLSEVAAACAKELSLMIFEDVAFKEYPCIKCNIGSSGEKIYHLPFDQQYDNTHIGKKPGEVYVSTVAEAQTLGFRHAMKHTFTV